MRDSESLDDRIARIIDEFLEDLRKGTAEDIEHYLARCPEAAEQLKEILASVAMVEGAVAVDVDEHWPSCPEPLGDPGPLPGMLGDYALVREIGRGGMGVVYEAEQRSLGRHVALKILPLHGRRDSRRLQRFQREARAVAMLHHTNIVPVFGVGEEDGVAYYAMQYIPGQSLDQVLEELRGSRQGSGGTPGPSRAVAEETLGVSTAAQSTQASLSQLSWPATSSSDSSQATRYIRNYWDSVAHVVAQVADALEYAHRRGVVHRDIKPSNLILDEQGTIWVTDFGLAKLRSEEDLTRTGELVGTLRYIPPEQFSGGADKRGDIYSLGLTLYELLTLRPAYEGKNREQLIQNMLSTDPTPPRRIDAQIPRDLETIVLKATAREVARRYASAGDMAVDLRRYLEDRPVLARRSGPLERGFRWARRNRLVATLALCLTLALLLGLAGTSWKWREAVRSQRRALANQETAERNLEHALDVVNEYLTQASQSTILQMDGMQTLRHELLESAVSYLEEFIREQEGQHDRLEVELARAYLNVGRIREQLGDSERAVPALREAVDLYRRLKPGSRILASACNQLGNALSNLGHYDQSVAAYQEAISTSQPDGGRDSGSSSSTDSIPAYVANIAKLYKSRYEYDLALAAYQEAIARQRQVVARRASPINRTNLSRMLYGLGSLWVELGRLSEAIAAHEEVLRMRQQLVEEFAEPERVHDLVGAWNGLALALDEGGQREQAQEHLRRAIELGERLVGRNPGVLDYRSTLAGVYSNQGNIWRETGHLSESLADLRKAIAIQEKLVDDYPAVVEFREFLSIMYENLALTLEEQDEVSAALDANQATIRILTETPEGSEQSYLYQLDLASAWLNRGRLLEESGAATRTPGGRSSIEEAYSRALAVFEPLLSQDVDSLPPRVRTSYADALAQFGTLQSRLKRETEALDAFERAIQFRLELPEGARQNVQNRLELVRLHRSATDVVQRTDPASAPDYQRRGEAIARELADQHLDVVDYRVEHLHELLHLAELLHDAGQSHEARDVLLRTLQASDDLVQRHPDVARAWATKAGVLNNLGNLEWADIHSDDYHRQALEIRRRLANEYPEMVDYHHEVAASLQNLANHCRLHGTTGRAVQLFQEAVEARQPALVGETPRLDAILDQAQGFCALAEVLHLTGDPTGSREALAQALAMQQRAEDRGASEQYPIKVAELSVSIADVFVLQGQTERALTSFQAAQQQFATMADGRLIGSERLIRVRLRNNLARLLASLRRFEQAQSLFDLALDEAQAVYHLQPHLEHAQEYYANVHLSQALLYEYQEQMDATSEQYRLAAEVQEQHRQRADSVMITNQLATTYNEWAAVVHSSQPAVARDKYARAEELLRSVLAADPRHLDARQTLGGVLCNSSRLADDPTAERLLGEAIEILQQALVENPHQARTREFLLNSHWSRAQLLSRQERYSDAVEDWDQAARLATGNYRYFLRVECAMNRARAGDLELAVREADQAAEDGPLPWTLFQAARVHAVAVAGLLKPETPSEEKPPQPRQEPPPPGENPPGAVAAADGSGDGDSQSSREQRDAYADRAVQLLQQAASEGFFESAGNRRLLSTDPDLKNLESYAAFQTLRDELRVE